MKSKKVKVPTHTQNYTEKFTSTNLMSVEGQEPYTA